MQAVRIQRKRVKGWRKPEGAVYIGYGTKYGNPFKWKDLPGGKKEAQQKFAEWLPGAIQRGEYETETLRGKIIMCYCTPADPCHGDIIIQHLKTG